jgi:hypothetical protein
MPRNLDDDAPRRIAAAERAVAGETAEEPAQEDGEEDLLDVDYEDWMEGGQRDVFLEARALRRKALTIEREITARRVRRRIRVGLSAGALGCVLACAGWTAAAWDSYERVLQGGIACGALALLLAVAALAVSPVPPGAKRGTLAALEDDLEKVRDDQQILGAFKFLRLRSRRHLCRESVADLVEQYRSESRRYRRVHNGLQVLVMTGSAGSTTVAALDWGQQPTWQSITLTGISFSITLASAFTGYYKYRERSYFLQQTADAIEEHLNALALGVGEYAGYEGNETGALAKFTKNVEGLRNEQRRRQQQLDQPAERADPGSQQPD